MSIPSAFRSHKFLFHVGFVISAFLLSGCQTQPTTMDPGAAQIANYERLGKENKDLEKSLAKSEARRKELEEKSGETQMRLLEKDAQISALEGQMKSQQKMLDDAVLEVVRAKARLRSLDSRAEAASSMAEAEIAVKALKIEWGAKEQDPDVIKARELLKMSADEFKNENYGGALYLTNQAKGHIKACQVRLRGRGGIALDNGTEFAQPLTLKVLRKSPLRKEPNHKSKTVGKLAKGTWLTAHAHKGEWVRVTCESGISGWVLQNALGSR
jgi:hypothetical protein